MRRLDCPTCGAEMNDTGFSGDVRHRGSVVGLDISHHTCPECGTMVDDDGNVHTLRDQQHDQAWREYANRIGDWSVVPR